MGSGSDENAIFVIPAKAGVSGGRDGLERANHTPRCRLRWHDDEKQIIQPPESPSRVNGIMKLTLLVLPLLFAAAPAAAAPFSGDPPPKVSTLVVFGNDPCPRSKDDEIVVCARQPESERYRIPKQFRKRPSTDAVSQSWVERARTLDMVSQKGLPNSCSPQGSNGQTGCMHQFLEAYRAEREAAKKGE